MEKFLTWKLRTSDHSVGVGAKPKDRLPGEAIESAVADSKACTRPAPMAVAGGGAVLSAFFMSISAWFIITALISAGLQVGCSCRSSVATPETCGAAIDVPENWTDSLPVPTAAAAMLRPGAEMSGFRSCVRRDGPSDVKPVRASSKPATGCGTSPMVALTVTVLKAPAPG